MWKQDFAGVILRDSILRNIDEQSKYGEITAQYRNSGTCGKNDHLLFP